MRLVVVESPYAATDWRVLARNKAYAVRAMVDCFRRGEAPLASHVLYAHSRVLDDLLPEERALGIQAGFEWARLCEHVAFYIDLGWSPGMREALKRHMGRHTIEERTLGDHWAEESRQLGYELYGGLT